MAHTHLHPRRELLTQVLVLIVTIAVLGVQLVGTHRSGSMALLADSAHVFTDVLASMISIYVAWKARSHHDEHRLRLFWSRVSGYLLLASLTAIILVSLWRLVASLESVHGGEMLRFALLGCGGNIAQLFLLQGAGRNLTTGAQRLHVLSDLASSLGVIASALLITWTGLDWIDPVAALLIGVYLACEAVRMLRGAAHHH